ncbi:MAG: hypothetical protein SVY53_11970 [Chloroflexota bacterium]|nr:hypothetical protein [Chloroflexota bacterium]
MKYGIRCMIRFSNKKDADDLMIILKDKLEQQYPDDDCQLEYHRCYHDEPTVKPCEIIEKPQPKPYLGQEPIDLCSFSEVL